jgi:hypothetical protein
VQPGVYLVLIFDGSELGQHTTWAYYHVLGSAPPPEGVPSAGTTSRNRAARASPQTDYVFTAVTLSVFAGLIVMSRRRRRRY